MGQQTLFMWMMMVWNSLQGLFPSLHRCSLPQTLIHKKNIDKVYDWCMSLEKGQKCVHWVKTLISNRHDWFDIRKVWTVVNWTSWATHTAHTKHSWIHRLTTGSQLLNCHILILKLLIGSSQGFTYVSLPGNVHPQYIWSETYLELGFQGRLTEKEEEIALRDELRIGKVHMIREKMERWKEVDALK